MNNLQIQEAQVIEFSDEELEKNSFDSMNVGTLQVNVKCGVSSFDFICYA